MTEYLSQELVDATDELRNKINETLQKMHAPVIGLSDTKYNRAKTFVDFNSWLLTANRKAIKELSLDFGLLPMVFTLSGVNVLDISLLQNTSKIDLLGHVRYISIALDTLTNQNDDIIIGVGASIFGEKFKSSESTKTSFRSKFVSDVLEYFINTGTNITYEQSMARLLSLITAD